MASDTEFGGAIAEFYQRHMVPMIFEPYAVDLAERLRDRREQWLLETAAGTGAVTRRLADALPASVPIIATDVSAAMVELGRTLGTSRPVDWRQADATALPFKDGSFDVVVCQFGIMFLADKVAGLSEAFRVLRPGGTLLFNTWDAITDNDFANTAVTAIRGIAPSDEPDFLSTVPHGYHEPRRIARDLAQAGFAARTPHLQTVTATSHAPSAREAAAAFCMGTPLRHEIEREPDLTLEAAINVAERAFVDQFGTGAIEGRLRAHVVTAWKD